MNTIKADVCDAAIPGLEPDNGRKCGQETVKCPHCSRDAGACAEHMDECRCGFEGCDDCLCDHSVSRSCGPQPIVDALDNPVAPMEEL